MSDLRDSIAHMRVGRCLQEIESGAHAALKALDEGDPHALVKPFLKGIAYLTEEALKEL